MGSRFRREMELFDLALGLRSEHWRATLERECSDDPTLVERVLRMLDAHIARGPMPVEDSPSTSFVRPGMQLGEFTLEKRLDDKHSPGGFGEVWLGVREHPQQAVAIKILRPDMHWSEAIARFERERKVLASLNHPHIAQFLASGLSSQGWHYFVMQYVDGVPITTYCDAKRLDVRARVGLMTSVAAAVQHAHTKGIVHRDLKPANVLVEEHHGVPHPMVIDFGIAKAIDRPVADLMGRTLGAVRLGSPDYMSPEQSGLRPLDVDARTDVYGLGALLYELLIGVTPFGFSSRRDLNLQAAYVRIDRDERPHASRRLKELDADQQSGIAQARATTPANLLRILSNELEWIPARAMELERDARYATAHEFGRDLTNYLTQRPLIAGPGTPTYELGKFIRKHRGPVVAVAAIAALLALGIGGTSYGLWKSQRSLAVAEASLGFLEESLGSASASQTGPSTRVIDVFREREGHLRSAFAKQPEVLWRLHRMYGRVYRSLSMPSAAHPHFDAAIDAAKHVLAPGSREMQELLSVRSQTQGDGCNPRGEAATASSDVNKGLLLHDLGDYDGAEFYLRESLRSVGADPALAEDTRDTRVAGLCEYLVWLLLDTGRVSEADDLAERSHRIRLASMPHSLGVASSFRTVGYVRLAQGRLDEARAALQRSAALYAERQSQEGTALEMMSRAMLDSIDLDDAPAHAGDPSSSAERQPKVSGEMWCFFPQWTRNRARLASWRGDHALVDRLFAQSLAESMPYESVDRWRPIEAHTRLDWALAQHAAKRLADAEANLRLARQAAVDAPSGPARGSLAAIEIALARVLLDRSDFREALDLLTTAVRVRRETLPRGAWPIHAAEFELARARHALAQPSAPDEMLRALASLESALADPASDAPVHPVLARARAMCASLQNSSKDP